MNANEAAIRKAYQVAEDKDVVGWVNCFTKDGTFTDESIGVTYRGPIRIGFTMSWTGARSARTTRLHYGLERVDPFGSISREVDAAFLIDDEEEYEQAH